MEKITTTGSIIYVLWLRQLKRYARSRARVIGSLGQPLLFLVALGFGFGPVYQKAGGGNYIEFLAPGVIAMGVLFTAMFAGIEIIWDRQFGFLKEMLVAPVSRLTIVIGRTLGGATVATLQGCIVLLLSLVIGFHITHMGSMFLGLLFMFLVAVLFTAFGTAVASMLEDMQGFQLIMNFLVMPTFFLSGALFPIDTAPQFLKLIAAFNPLSYGVDGLRAAFGAGGHFGIPLDLLVLSLATLFLLAVGSYLFSKIEI
ncbi:MAG: ABC transporter permease [Patescibacteria group bacterium]|nr:ABC transporter permease [Patescibacteria group bacterium]MDE2438333.1 ABC transporter permease [Patescibacteria group bacterium]